MSLKLYIQLLSVVIFSVLALHFESPIDVQPIDHDEFSAARAFEDIENIADKIHFIGSDANKEKKEYIISRFKELGYSPRLFIGESYIQWGGNHRQAKTENILVEKKGTEGKKKVVVLGHYDSVTNSPGASDDGHSIACMLEVASLIKNSSFANDILFLITDGEETGLHGARAYAQKFNLDSIGIVLNFEARGNTGPTIAFEWSDNNAWLVNAFKKNVTRPIANSLSYEIYNRMPNGSDFTEFKDRGVPGINNAFIDGFVYYHSPIDNPENINLESVQHSGDNMYHLVKYFGDEDLEIEHKGNATFFNLFSTLIVFPSGLNIIFLLISGLLVLFLLAKWMKGKRLKPSSFLLSITSNILLLLISAGIGFLFQALVKWMYPHYFQFYAGQFYNHKLYLLALVGLIILLQGMGGRWIFRKWAPSAYSGSLLFTWLVLSIITYALAPGAAYLFMVPLMVLVVFLFAKEFLSKIKNHKYGDFIDLLPLAVVLGIWVPSFHSLFLAFSLSSLIAPSIILFLLVSFIMPLTPDVWGHKRMPLIIGVSVFLFAMIYGDLTSTPTEDSPLPSNLNYYYNQNDSLGYWITSDKVLNEANAGAIEKGELTEVDVPRKVKRLAYKTEISFHFPIIIQKSESEDQLHTTFSMSNEALISYVHFRDLKGVENISLNGNELYDSNDSNRNNFLLSLFGYGNDTLTFDIIKSQNIDKEIVISTFNEGIPRKDIIPANYMRTGGHTITTFKLNK